jgi:uncharacterized repeat protein (TIGR01451 family)
VCWKDGVSGIWSLDQNWNSGRVPLPADLVCIEREGTYTVTVDVDAQIAGLIVGGVSGNAELFLDGVTLTLDGDAEIRSTGSLTVFEGAVDTAPGITVTTEARTVIEGETRISGSLVNGPNGVLGVRGSSGRGDALLTVGEGLVNRGEIVLENVDTGPRTVGIVVEGAGLENRPGSVLTSSGSGGGDRSISGDVVNSGELRISGGSLIVEGNGLVNLEDGLITVDNGVLEAVLTEAPSLAKSAPQFANAGSIALSSGTRVRIRGSSSRLVSSAAATPKAFAAFVNTGSILTAVNSVFEVIDLDFINEADGELAGAGTFDVAAAFSAINHGMVFPGASIGLLRVYGDLDYTASARLLIEIRGSRPGVDLDTFQVIGALTLDGILEVILRRIVPEAGDRFEFLRFESLSGEFERTLLPNVPDDLGWELVTNPSSMELVAVCQGPQLLLDAIADKQLVSVGYEVLFTVTVQNTSPKQATGVVVRDLLPPQLSFTPAGSSSGCRVVGADVECTVGSLPPSGQAQVTIAAEPVLAGRVTNPIDALHNECIADATGYSKSVTVQVTSAEPCDANDDGVVAADDVVTAVGYMFGEEAAGNPDCAVGGGINAEDLALIVIEAGRP